MPELVAEVEQPPAILAVERPMVLAEVRDVVHQVVEPPVIRPADKAASGILDLAEIAGKGDLLFVGNVLVMEDEHRVAVHPLIDRRDPLRGERLAQIQPAHLADKNRMNLADRNRHPQRPALKMTRKRYALVTLLSWRPTAWLLCPRLATRYDRTRRAAWATGCNSIWRRSAVALRASARPCAAPSWDCAPQSSKLARMTVICAVRAGPAAFFTSRITT